MGSINEYGPGRELKEKEIEIYWKECPRSRRTLRYLIEKSVQLAPPESPLSRKENLASLTDTIYIAARNLVDLSNISDQLHYFYPNGEVELIIFPPRQKDLWTLKYQTDIQKRRIYFQEMIKQHYTEKGEDFDDSKFTLELFKKELDAPFQKEIGITFQQGFSFIYHMKQFCRTPKDSFDVFFIPENKVYQSIANNFSIPERSVQKFIAGLTLIKESIDDENREQFDTKRHFQPTMRPFALLQHSEGLHLIWDTYTLEATFLELIGNMTFKKIPQEWELFPILEAVTKINKTLSTRFARQVSKIFEMDGWKNDFEIKYLIDSKGYRHKIVPGEIDILALSPNCEIIAQVECKRICKSDDTRTYRDDLSDFYGDGEFVKKAQNKHKWLTQNRSILIEHMKKKTKLDINNSVKILPIFLTLYPSFAAVKATEIPIISAKVFFKGLKSDSTYWPGLY